MSTNQDQSHLQEQIAAIEKELRETPHHKATDHHIGRLRAKMSLLNDRLIETSSKSGGGGRGYAVKKQGDATVTLIGAPSVGKSTLLNKLTNAHSKIAPYAFTTVTVIPGMMEYKNAKIQILDVPGLIQGAEIGKGRGKEVLSVARGSDLLLIMSDLENLGSLHIISESLENSGIRINKQKPNVIFNKKIKGGVHVFSNIKQDFDKEMVKQVAREFRFGNGDITIKEKISLPKLIDSFSRNIVYIPAIYIINKIDKLDSSLTIGDYPSAIKISADSGLGLDDLKDSIWNNLNLINVYLVRPEEEPNNDHPIVLKRGKKLTDILDFLGSDFSENKKSAVIWGNGAKYSAQEVSLNTEAKDGMQVRFI